MYNIPVQSLPTLKTGRSHLGPACFGVLDVSLLLPKAEVHFTVLIDLNVHGLDVAGIELILFTGGHIRPGHFVNLSEDILDVEVYLFLQALTQLLQQGSFLDLVAVAGAEIIQISQTPLKRRKVLTKPELEAEPLRASGFGFCGAVLLLSNRKQCWVCLNSAVHSTRKKTWWEPG